MASSTLFVLVCVAIAATAALGTETAQFTPTSTVNISDTPELTERLLFPAQALQFNYGPGAILSTSSAGTTYSMDLISNPILATLPGPGFSQKVDVFQPCSFKTPHVHPRASKLSWVVNGVLQVGIAEEDTGRVLDFNVTQGNSIVVPQGLLHYMRNNNCTHTLTMLTVFNSKDAGELTMLDKILKFPNDVVLASTGLNQAAVDQLQASLPNGPGDLRIDYTCVAACGLSLPLAASPTVSSPTTTAG